MARLKNWLPDPESMFAELEALAAEETAARRRRKQPRAQVAKQRASAARNRKQRFREANAKRLAEQKAKYRARYAPPYWASKRAEALRLMLPGEWYARHDLVKASGGALDKQQAALAILDMEKRGEVERAACAEPQTRMAFSGAVMGAKWLFRLTRHGEAWRALMLML